MIGPVIVAAGFALFAVPGVGGAYWTTFFPAVVVLGLGMALSVAPLTTAVMNSVETHQAGVASGVNNAASRVAGLLGVAVMSIIIATAFNAGLDRRLLSLDLSTETRALVDEQRVNLAAAQVSVEAGGDTQAALDRAFKEAYVSGFRLVMLFAAGLALTSAVTAGAMIEGKKGEGRRVLPVFDAAETERVGP
jgi:hypothetical protein